MLGRQMSCCGRLAQRLAHLLYTEVVAGSNPAAPTIFSFSEAATGAGAFLGQMNLLADRCRRRPIASMRELPHPHSCFVCGAANPLGLKLRFETDGHRVQTRFVPRPEHIGFRDIIHGGLLATILDEIMVWVCAVRTRRFAFCAEMSVRYLRPVHPRVELQIQGELTADRRGKIFEAQAAVENSAGETLVIARGKYIPVKASDLPPLLDELVGDWRWLLDPGQPPPDYFTSKSI